MSNEILLLIPTFFIIAFFYSTAGFGGGSSYLAILALFPLEYSVIKTTALLCNITVVSGGVFIFQKKKLLHWKKILPLVLLSIPFAYLGGLIKLEESIFFILLGSTLLLAAIFMLFNINEQKWTIPNHKISNGLLGGSIGFLSGLVGIGGGVFLAPILYLSNWEKPKIIAATASFFILVNSIAGILGQVTARNFNFVGTEILFLLLAVFLGGQLGSRMTINFLQPQSIKKITALLIGIIAIRILYENLL